MRRAVERKISGLGFMASVSVLPQALLLRENSKRARRDESHHDPRTIRPYPERMAA